MASVHGVTRSGIPLSMHTHMNDGRFSMAVGRRWEAVLSLSKKEKRKIKRYLTLQRILFPFKLMSRL